MKRIKLLALILCLVAATLTLASCFSSNEEFTEWELKENTLTGGGISYYLYSGSDDAVWQASNNNTFYYINTVELDDGRYAELSRPIGREDIILADFYYEHEYGYSKNYSRYYCLDSGRAALDALASSNEVGYVSLLDRANLNISLASADLLLLADTVASSGRESVSMSYFKLNSLQRLDLTSFALEGFLAHNHGAFFFDYGNVYYLNLEELPQDALTDGVISSKYNNYSLVRLTADECALLDTERAKLEHYDEKLEWEEPTYIADDGTDTRHAGALAVLLVIEAALGILLPLLPMIYTLVGCIKKKWQAPIYDYVMLGASFLWLVSGIVIFIVLLA